MKKLYRSKLTENSSAGRKSMSPHRTIAVPQLLKGLSSFSFKKKADFIAAVGTPSNGDSPNRFFDSRFSSRKTSQYSVFSSLVGSEGGDS